MSNSIYCHVCNDKCSISKGIRDPLTGHIIIRSLPCPQCQPEKYKIAKMKLRIENATREGVLNAKRNQHRKRYIVKNQRNR